MASDPPRDARAGPYQGHETRFASPSVEEVTHVAWFVKGSADANTIEVFGKTRPNTKRCRL